jgi:hypothetical protein
LLLAVDGLNRLRISRLVELGLMAKTGETGA